MNEEIIDCDGKYEIAEEIEDATDNDECCPECGHPKDGSSGHGHCDHACHGAA